MEVLSNPWVLAALAGAGTYMLITSMKIGPFYKLKDENDPESEKELDPDCALSPPVAALGVAGVVLILINMKIIPLPGSGAPTFNARTAPIL
jgi:hypothetical protein